MSTTIPAGRYSDVNSAFVQAYIDQKIASVIDLAPETLNSLNEIAAAIGDDANFVTTVNDAIAAVQADVNLNETAAATLVSDLETARNIITDALSGRLDTLETDPTTQSYVDGINTALDGRLDILEADPTTQTLLDAETTARSNADTALDGRLDVLEVDPTTQTAVDAKLNIADPAATGKLTVDTEAALEFDSNLTKLHNELRGTRIDVGNNITVYPAAAGGRFEIEGGLYIRLSDLEEHNNDTDAGNAGIVVGGVYYDSNGHLRIRRS
jgi:hypothetical protein